MVSQRLDVLFLEKERPEIRTSEFHQWYIIPGGIIADRQVSHPLVVQEKYTPQQDTMWIKLQSHICVNHKAACVGCLCCCRRRGPPPWSPCCHRRALNDWLGVLTADLYYC